MTAYSAIPNLIYYFAREESVSLSIYESILTLAFFIFITSKIFLTPMLTKDATSEVVSKIIAIEEARREAIESKESTEEPEQTSAEEDENQITISYEEPIENDTAEQTAKS